MPLYIDNPSFGFGRIKAKSAAKTIIEFPSQDEAKVFLTPYIEKDLLPASKEHEARFLQEVEKAIRLKNEKFKSRRPRRFHSAHAPNANLFRATNCWFCRKKIDNVHDFACPDCNGIICPRDGACLCGWQG